MNNYQIWKDEHGFARLLNHNQEPVPVRTERPLEMARQYLTDVAKLYNLEPEWIKNCINPLKSNFNPSERVSLYLNEIKEVKGGSVVSFSQTYSGIPIWSAGLTLVVRDNPGRILSSTNTLYFKMEVPKLDGDALKKIMLLNGASLAKIMGLDSRFLDTIRLNGIRPVIYCYDDKKRNGTHVLEETKGVAFDEFHPSLPLPVLSQNIVHGGFYLAVEVLFSLIQKKTGRLNWRAIVTTDGQVLYCEAAIDNVTGQIFRTDPSTLSGSLATVPNSTNAILNPLRSSVTLPGLVAPVGGQQCLTGEFIRVSDVEAFTVAPPTTASPFDFSYDVRTNNFAAVNAYYHCDAFFRMVRDRGFTVSTYFNGTTFPLTVDHRGRFGTADGIEINASCSGTVGIDGISMVDFELATTTDNAANPMGIACDWRVVLHELGGHGILWDHVSHPNFGFAHSAGDSFASILNDPETTFTGADRFLTFPWVSAIINRRHDRTVAAGWGWGGANDSGGYNSEQVLNTTLFRLYRSLGGDSASLGRRQLAANFTTYLILKAVESLTPLSNPANATAFEHALESADGFDFDPINPSAHFESGAYYKVIRWAFEKQGLFRAAGTPNTAEGAPPDVDVYINDGRNGEYTFQPTHWNCTDIWNRLVADGGAGHEDPITAQTNYAYVRIKNRGTSAATNVVVKGFHALPGVGLVYPTDWIPMATPQLNAPNIAANDAVGVVVGPFEWVPSQVGHECMFFSVSANGDPSNIDGRITGAISEWRLVPNDNNLAQRNVTPVAGGLGIKGLLSSLANHPFWIRNHERERVKVSFQATIPAFLSESRWVVSLPRPFTLAYKEVRQFTPKLVKGRAIKDFNFRDIRFGSNYNITITVLFDGMPYGGMTYRIDPHIKQ